MSKLLYEIFPLAGLDKSWYSAYAVDFAGTKSYTSGSLYEAYKDIRCELRVSGKLFNNRAPRQLPTVHNNANDDGGIILYHLNQ